jgi:hypothetical protein
LLGFSSPITSDFENCQRSVIHAAWPVVFRTRQLQESQQAAVVLGLFVALAAGTSLLVGPIFQFLQQLLPEGWCLVSGMVGRWGGGGWGVVWKMSLH